MARNKNAKESRPQKRTGPKTLARRRDEPSLAGALTPFSFVGRVMEEMDRLAEDVGLGRGLRAAVDRNLPRGAWAPQAEMFERNGEFVLRADLPGLDKDDLTPNPRGSDRGRSVDDARRDFF